MCTTDLTCFCHHRRRVSNAVLQKAGDELCGKLFLTPVMVECLKFAATTGTLAQCSALHQFLLMFVRHAKISTEHVEATNHILKVEVTIAPTISWELLKSRLTVKKSVALMSNGDRKTLLKALPGMYDSVAAYIDTDGFRMLDADTTRHQWEATFSENPCYQMIRFHVI